MANLDFYAKKKCHKHFLTKSHFAQNMPNPFHFQNMNLQIQRRDITTYPGTLTTKQ